MSADRHLVRLELESSPETLTLVRGMLGGVAEQLSLDAELLDDLKTAVSEAANNVVMHAYGGESGPLSVCLTVEPDAIEVAVRDQGQGIPMVTSSDDRLQGVGIPIMRALAQQTAFRRLSGGGTEVWLQFAAVREGRALYQYPTDVAPEDGWTERLSGDAVVSLSPLSLVGGVLGRLARALAARARFSLDRFSDVYLVTDALAALSLEAASSARISFSILTQNRRLELRIGPFRSGSATAFGEGDPAEATAALRLLANEFEIRPENGVDSLRLVMLDERERSTVGSV